jgi:hypothetical protein
MKVNKKKVKNNRCRKVRGKKMFKISSRKKVD